MSIALPGLLKTFEMDIIHRWVHRLHTECGELYASRSEEELYKTVSKAYAANYEFLAENDLHLIDEFIDKITRMRLDAGFKLTDVQKKPPKTDGRHE